MFKKFTLGIAVALIALSAFAGGMALTNGNDDTPIQPAKGWCWNCQ